MSFDPVSYAAGMAAGKKAGGGGREPVLERLSVTENGIYTPEEGVDGFAIVDVSVDAHYSEGYNQGYNQGYEDGRNAAAPSLTSLQVSQNGIYIPAAEVDGFNEVEVDVPIGFAPLADQASAWDIRSGTEAYDHEGNVIQGLMELPPPLQNQAAAGDIRYGKACYDSNDASVISGTLQNIHQQTPVYWDDVNDKFDVANTAVQAAMLATLTAEGAITGYLVNSETSIPIPCVLHLDANQNLVLTGGICVVNGSDTDKYIVYCNIGVDGTISNEKNSLIRVVTTVSRNLSQWMADGDYLALFLRT